MKSFAAILVAACLAHSLCAFRAQECIGAPSTDCSALPTLRVVGVDRSCSGTVTPNCKRWILSKVAFQEAFSEWWSGGDKVCDTDAVIAAGRAVANAIAQIWTSVAKDVECSEPGKFACGWFFADGETFGKAVAELVARAASDVFGALGEDGDEAGADVADSFCFADIRAIAAPVAGGMVRAVSDAAADACEANVDACAVYTESFETAIRSGITNALLSAVESVCQDFEDIATSNSGCTGTGEVTGETVTGGAGEFCVGTKKVFICTGIVEEACCTNTQKRNCRVPVSGTRRFATYWRSKRAGSTLVGTRDGDICLCDEP